jgi:hypothetical protein
MARGLLARNRALAMPASVRAGEVWGDDGGAHEDVGGVGELENLSGGGVDAQDREPCGTGEAGGSFEVDPCVGVPDFGEVV